MKLRNEKPVAQIIDAAGGMVVPGGAVSGSMPAAVAEHLLKTQPDDWSKVKPGKKGGGK